MTSTDRRITEEEVTTSETRDTGMVARVIGVLAGAVPTVIGLIALLRIDWFDQGFDAPAVDVAGLSFTPGVAIGTTVAGVLAILAAASWDRGSKLVVGAVLACIGVAILIPDALPTELNLENGHGWLSLGVGAVLILTSLFLHAGSHVSTRGYRGQHLDR
jgi:hypothetical protein